MWDESAFADAPVEMLHIVSNSQNNLLKYSHFSATFSTLKTLAGHFKFWPSKSHMAIDYQIDAIE